MRKNFTRFSSGSFRLLAGKPDVWADLEFCVFTNIPLVLEDYTNYDDVKQVFIYKLNMFRWNILVFY